MTPAVMCHRLTKHVGVGVARRAAVCDVTLAVDPGEFLAVEGPSGAGKSTLLHLVVGIDRPDDGYVELDGVRLTDLSDRQRADLRRRRVGIVLQTIDLIPGLTAWENVAVPGLLGGGRVAQHRHEACELLEAIGVAGDAGRRPSELSGGEQQRVAIARALFNKPALVVADEPTGALDSVTGDEILRLFRRIADRGGSVLMATHSPRAAAFSDRAVTLVDGRLST